jgi:hypothetical protein
VAKFDVFLGLLAQICEWFPAYAGMTGRFKSTRIGISSDQRDLPITLCRMQTAHEIADARMGEDEIRLERWRDAA